jgi:hypothetical protein
MKLRIRPIHGYGWTASDGSPVEMPDEFLLDAEEGPIGTIRGRVTEQGHPLNELWVVLSQRHAERDGHYNFSAFAGDPQSTMVDRADVAGFVEATPSGV